MLSYMLVKTDYGLLENSIFYESYSICSSLTHLNFHEPLWKFTTDTKLFSSVITTDHTQTLYYTSERTVLALLPSHISDNNSLGPLSTVFRRDLAGEQIDTITYKENILLEDFENNSESWTELIRKHVWIVLGFFNLLIAAVALGFRLGRKYAKGKSKGSHRNDEVSKLTSPTTVQLNENGFKINSENEGFTTDTKHISTIFSLSSVPSAPCKEVKQLITDDLKHSRKATLLIETENISPIIFKPLKSITCPVSASCFSFSKFDSENKAKDVSFLDNFQDMSEESPINKVVPYRPYNRFFEEHRNQVVMTEEKKHEYLKEKFIIQPLLGLEKETQIDSEVRFERTDNLQNFKKIETHIITTTYQNTEEVAKYYENLENCDKAVLAVQGSIDHVTSEVTLEAESIRTSAKAEIQFSKSQFQENKSFSEEEEDAIEFKRSFSKSSEGIRARESQDPDFKELFEVLDDGNYCKQFIVEKLLGKGGFGAVYLVIST